MRQSKTICRLLRRGLPLAGALLMLGSLVYLAVYLVRGGAAGESGLSGEPPATAAATRSAPPAVARRAPAAPSSEPAPAAPAEGGEEAETEEEEEELSPGERAIAHWESLVDAAMDLTGPPPLEKAEAFKKAFDAMTPEDRIENIDYALNLLPDEQFPVLYLILLDKRQDPDILDAIFSDALNRDEVIKIPLMKELRKDKEHPMYVESARILDVIDE